MHEIFSTPQPVSLYAEVGAGDLLVTTADTDETDVEVTGEGADEVLVEQRDGEVLVIARQRRGGFLGFGGQQLAVRVTMPHGSRLATKLGSVDVRVTGRLGQASVRTGSGDVRIEELTGESDLVTGSGDVSVRLARAGLEVKTGSGDVILERMEGPTRVSTGSGDVVVHEAVEPVTVSSGSGDMRVRDAQRDVALKTASGDLVVDRMVRGQLLAKNVSGDITVGIPSGVPVWTDISCVTGRVRSDLDGAGEPAEGQDYVELRATTVSGDVYLRQI